MSAGLQFDEDAARRIEAIYTTPDVVAQRAAALRALTLAPGERVLDIGAGPGFLASEIGTVVGPAGSVCGLDISESFLGMARQRCSAQPWIEFRTGEATSLPSADASRDVCVSTQVYEYVPDVDLALREVYRVLRPGGRVLIVDTDWDSIVWHSADRARMERVLKVWDEHLADPYLPRTLIGRLTAAGFVGVRCEIIPLLNAERDPNTYSYGAVGLVAAFVKGRQCLPDAEVDAWAAELRDDTSVPYFFSLNRYLFMARKPAER